MRNMIREPLLFRWAVRILPRRWRDSVERDLLEEASRSHRRGLRLAGWLTLQAIGIALAMAMQSLSRWWHGGPRWQSFAGGLGLDLRLAWRAIGRQPWSTSAIVLILAVGLSSSTAAYQRPPSPRFMSVQKAASRLFGSVVVGRRSLPALTVTPLAAPSSTTPFTERITVS